MERETSADYVSFDSCGNSILRKEGLRPIMSHLTCVGTPSPKRRLRQIMSHSINVGTPLSKRRASPDYVSFDPCGNSTLRKEGLWQIMSHSINVGTPLSERRASPDYVSFGLCGNSTLGRRNINGHTSSSKIKLTTGPPATGACCSLCRRSESFFLGFLSENCTD